MNVRERLVGAWRLVSVSSRDARGEPFLHHDRGMLHYTPSGRMSAQVCDSRRPPFAGTDWFSATEAELRSAFNGCLCYFGTYDVDEPAGEVIHRVEGSLFPNWAGAVQRRLYQFDGDRLSLSTIPSLQAQVTLTWERVD